MLCYVTGGEAKGRGVLSADRKALYPASTFALLGKTTRRNSKNVYCMYVV